MCLAGWIFTLHDQFFLKPWAHLCPPCFSACWFSPVGSAILIWYFGILLAQHIYRSACIRGWSFPTERLIQGNSLLCNTGRKPGVETTVWISALIVLFFSSACFCCCRLCTQRRAVFYKPLFFCHSYLHSLLVDNRSYVCFLFWGQQRCALMWRIFFLLDNYAEELFLLINHQTCAFFFTFCSSVLGTFSTPEDVCPHSFSRPHFPFTTAVFPLTYLRFLLRE